MKDLRMNKVESKRMLEKVLIKEDKRYQHFDFPLSKEKQRKLLKRWLNPKNICHHSFAPFIAFNIKQQKTDGVKVTTKLRPIKLVAHHDALIYRLYGYYLNCVYEKYIRQHNFTDVPQAYRANHSSISTAKYAFDYLWQQKNGAWVIKGDFSHFFDNVNHHILLSKVRKLLMNDESGYLPADWMHVLKSIMRYRYITKKQFKNFIDQYNRQNTNKSRNSRFTYYNKCVHTKLLKLSARNKVGIPEGTAISAALANVYMIDFDLEVKQFVQQYKGLFLRYSDDFVIILPATTISYDQVEHIIKNISMKSSNDLKIAINNKKTSILRYKDQQIWKDGNRSVFNFLGFSFNGRQVTFTPSVMYRFHQNAKYSLRILAENTKVWRGQTIDNVKRYENIQALKKQGYNLPARKSITKRFLTSQPISRENALSYAYNAQRILTSGHPTNWYIVTVFKDFRRQVARMQNYYYQKLN